MFIIDVFKRYTFRYIIHILLLPDNPKIHINNLSIPIIFTPLFKNLFCLCGTHACHIDQLVYCKILCSMLDTKIDTFQFLPGIINTIERNIWLSCLFPVLS